MLRCIRIDKHTDAEVIWDALGELPKCTSEERWAKPDTYAVMKKGRKTALRLLPTEEQAKEYIGDQDFSVEFRKGVSTRCEGYCEVSQFCNQYRVCLA